MAVEWGVIWTAEDEEEVHTSNVHGVIYESKDQVLKDIRDLPYMKGQLVTRVVEDWHVVPVESARPTKVGTAKDRHILKAVADLERARALVRGGDA